MAPVEPWERVWIDAETFAEDIHSYINCTECHAGQAVEDFELAHDGLKTNVVTNPEVCGRCHVDNGLPAFESLHNSLSGYDTAIYARSAPEHYEALEEMEAKHCNSCHATCGDCHVSTPSSAGGGLLEGHVFKESPSMSQNCTACHGSRVKDEYYGAHEEASSDVHFRNRMDCMECHTADEMHGMNMEDVNSRYDGEQMPSCESCHEDIVMGEESDIREHYRHQPDSMSCQVCHSQTYINCVNCHVEQSEDGVPYFTVEDNFMGFYIGRNDEITEERPYRYVPVRHVPIEPDSFSFYGENLLPNFDARPTWVYATPHNIQRVTPQAALCTHCHDNEDIWLMEDMVTEDELVANKAVIIEAIPEMYGD